MSKKAISAKTKVSMNERDVRAWKNAIDSLIDTVGEDVFARFLYERLKDRREEFADFPPAQEFFAMMDAKMLKEEQGGE